MKGLASTVTAHVMLDLVCSDSSAPFSLSNSCWFHVLLLSGLKIDRTEENPIDGPESTQKHQSISGCLNWLTINPHQTARQHSIWCAESIQQQVTPSQHGPSLLALALPAMQGPFWMMAVPSP